MRSNAILPDELVERLARIKRLQGIVLFGSYARGEADRRSDLDLLLVFDTRQDIQKHRKELLGVLKEYRQLPLALIKRSAEDLASDPSFMFNVFKEGYVLYKRPDAGLLPVAISREKLSIVYSYDLSKLPHEQKLKFNAALYTRVKGKYRYPGLLERVGGQKLSYGAIMVPANAEREVDKLLQNYNVKARKINVVVVGHEAYEKGKLAT
jgi:predicted nucleotidyltransferase